LAADDLDGDGIDELVVASPSEAVGTVPHAGAVNVIYGSATGLNRGRASQLFTQDSPGVADTVEPYDGFGGVLTTGDVNEPEVTEFFGQVTAGDFDGDGNDDLAIGIPYETVGPVQAAGAVNILYGGQPRLSGIGSQLFTQDRAGIGTAASERWLATVSGQLERPLAVVELGPLLVSDRSSMVLRTGADQGKRSVGPCAHVDTCGSCSQAVLSQLRSVARAFRVTTSCGTWDQVLTAFQQSA
jgi:hypothetical protein